MPELILILVVALLIFGPERLPEIARTIGKTLQDLRAAATSAQKELTVELEALPPAKPHPLPATSAFEANQETTERTALPSPASTMTETEDTAPAETPAGAGVTTSTLATTPAEAIPPTTTEETNG